jgi:hypothetical protein
MQSAMQSSRAQAAAAAADSDVGESGWSTADDMTWGSGTASAAAGLRLQR